LREVLLDGLVGFIGSDGDCCRAVRVGDCLLTRVMGESAMYSMMRRRARSARRSGALSGCNL